MNKAELKSRWGKYTDTNKLVDDIRELLTRANYRNSEHGVCTMLDVYFTNKEPLIKLFQKSPNYNGDMRIVKMHDFQNIISSNVISNFCFYFIPNMNIRNALLKNRNHQGKTLAECYSVGKKTLKIADLEEFSATFNEISRNISEFGHDGYTTESWQNLSIFEQIINLFGKISNSALTVSQMESLHTCNPNIQLVPGMKTSRAFNTICHHYGVDTYDINYQVKIKPHAKYKDGCDVPDSLIGSIKIIQEIHDDYITLIGVSQPIHKKHLTLIYDHLFAQYADLVTNKKHPLQYVVSLNPYDYLTMSYGNSWSSCHHIGNHSSRCGGTLSYMLDSSSIITYCVSPNTDVRTAGKVYRNMCHYQDGILLQNRLYPATENRSNIRTEFNQLIQEEMSTILELKENKWIEDDTYSYDIHSYGAHYPDHSSSYNRTVMISPEKLTKHPSLNIGHTGICVYCGESYSANNNLCHNSCTIGG